MADRPRSEKYDRFRALQRVGVIRGLASGHICQCVSAVSAF